MRSSARSSTGQSVGLLSLRLQVRVLPGAPFFVGETKMLMVRHKLKFAVHGEDRSGWSIRYGVSQFLVAYGSGWSLPIGRRLFNELRYPQAAVARKLKRVKQSRNWRRQPSQSGFSANKRKCSPQCQSPAAPLLPALGIALASHLDVSRINARHRAAQAPAMSVNCKPSRRF